MKKQAINTFDGGWVADIDELHAKPNTLTYARNTEYITTEGNQLILQKREGRQVKVNVTTGYSIKAVEVIDDVAYIISTRIPNTITGDIINIYSGSQVSEWSFYFDGIYRGQLFDVSVLNTTKVTGASFYARKGASGSTFKLRSKLFGYNDVNGFTIDKTLLGTSDIVDSSELSTSYKYVNFTYSEEIDISAYDKVIAAVESIDGGDVFFQLSLSPSAYPDGNIVYGSSGTGNLSMDPTEGAFRCKLHGSYVTESEAELGTFPSPAYTSPIADDTIVPMVEQYSPLKNYRSTYSSSDENYYSSFNTKKLNIAPDSEVGLELQKTYDGSVNMVFSSDDNPVRLINTKFKVNGDGTATLVKRRLDKNDNVYSEAEFHKTELIPRPTTVGYISNVTVKDGGQLPAGGYRYYMKYITADGVETDLFEESRTIDIHYANNVLKSTGGKEGEIIPKMVKLSLSNLDRTFKGVRVYFSVSAGEVTAATKLFQIVNTFDISSGGAATIIHTGFENTIDADPTKLGLSYTQIKNSKIITKVNNRLALSGPTASLNHKDDYAKLATYLQIRSEVKDDRVEAPCSIQGNISSKTHANPTDFYLSGEYWDAETYEIAVVFITKDGDTPAYPVQGMDKLKGVTTYQPSRLGITDNGFLSTSGQNPYGVYRTEAVDSFFYVDRKSTTDYSDDIMKFRTVHLKIYTHYFRAELSEYPEIIGYYFVRKKRKRDALMRGLLCPTAAIPQVTTFGNTNIVKTTPAANGGRVGVDSILDGGHKRVPIPDMIMPYAVTRIHDGDTEKLIDMQLRAPVHPLGTGWSTSHAFYSPDIDCNTAFSASAFASRTYGTHVYKPYNMRSVSIQKNYTGASLNKAGLYLYNSWIYPSSYNSQTLSTTKRQTGTISFVNENTLGSGAGAFAGNTDRNLWLWAYNWNLTRSNLTNSKLNEYSNDVWVISDWYNHDVDDDDKEFAGNALKYGRYAGIRYEWLREMDLEDMHMPYKQISSSSKGFTNVNFDYTLAGDATEDRSYNTGYFTPNNITGYLCTIYEGTQSGSLAYSYWTEKYASDDNSAYYAVSRRYPISTTADYLDLGDGDCYSGLMWKRVFRPRGIDEAPQATDTKAYSEDYRNVGMANFGYAISVPTKSNYNFHLRVPSSKNDKEYELFGEKRSFLPVQGHESIRGAKLDETEAFNHGYGASHESLISVFRLNPDSPYYKAEQPNRVYVSDTDIESNFLNGFTQFKGLSYRDYNSELGPINEMVTFNGKIVAVFDSGVATIGVDERSLIPGSEGDIFMDSAKALASKSEVKSTVFGSDQPTSVKVTGKFVYGVDTKQYKIWRTNGDVFEPISDLKVQSWLKNTISGFNSSLDKDNKFIVYTTYDTRKSEVVFTCALLVRATGDLIDSKTIVYNELLDVWVCETDEHRSELFYIDENKYSIRPNSENTIYSYDDGILSNLLNTEPVEKTVIEFILNKEQSEIKVLENLMIVGNSVVPEQISYTSDIYKKRKDSEMLYQDIITRTPVVVRLKEATNVSINSTYTFTFADTGLDGIIQPLTRLPLDIGDLISLVDDAGGVLMTKIVNISEDSKTVTIAHPVTNTDTFELYTGHKTDLRQFNTEIHEGVTYLIPSCKVASNITQPRGKWIKVRIEIDSADKMYITGIASVYNQSLS